MLCAVIFLGLFSILDLSNGVLATIEVDVNGASDAPDEDNVPAANISVDYEAQFIWGFGDWSECSTTCAEGSQKSSIICKRADDGTIVNQSYCNLHTMPTEKTRPCSLKTCEAQWFVEQWEPCSATCGGAERTRLVSCKIKSSALEDEVVDDKLCPDEKPIERESCKTDVCPPQWATKPWTECSAGCGIGWKKREVVCVSNDGGERYPDVRCNQEDKPSTGARCNAGTCPAPKWHVGSWGRCDTQCGVGQQRRKIVCLTHERTRSLNCSTNERPPNIKSCRVECTSGAPVVDDVCVDDPKFGHCGLVRRFNFCKRGYFRKLCCQSCSA